MEYTHIDNVRNVPKYFPKEKNILFYMRKQRKVIKEKRYFEYFVCGFNNYICKIAFNNKMNAQKSLSRKTPLFLLKSTDFLLTIILSSNLYLQLLNYKNWLNITLWYFHVSKLEDSTTGTINIIRCFEK